MRAQTERLEVVFPMRFSRAMYGRIRTEAWGENLYEAELIRKLVDAGLKVREDIKECKEPEDVVITVGEDGQLQEVKEGQGEIVENTTSASA
jgi:hypothetical protein